MKNLPPVFRCLRATVAGLLLSICAYGAADNGLYDHAKMKSVELNGLRVWLGQPVEVTSQIGWGMSWVHPGWQPAWSFIHLTPYMAKFPGGDLIATYTMGSRHPGKSVFPQRLPGLA